jgi:hypothetical protein
MSVHTDTLALVASSPFEANPQVGRAATTRRLRVAFVGGVHRAERDLATFGAELGLEVEVHDGRVRGNAKARLAALVRRTEVLFIVTGTNSHGAVLVAKREAAKTGARVHILKACGSGTARALLTEVARAGTA